MKLASFFLVAAYLSDKTKLQPSLWVRGNILEGAIDAHILLACVLVSLHAMF
jgi:hypothetical protein